MGRRRKSNTHLPRFMLFKHGAYYFVSAVDGRKVWKPLGRDYGQALRTYAEIVGESADPAETVGEAMAQYLGVMADKLKPDTLSGYRQSMKRLAPVFGAMRVGDLRREHVYRYVIDLGTTAANRDRAFLSAVYTHLLRLGAVGDNPCKGLHYRNPEKPRRRYITDTELAAIVEALPEQLSLMARFAYLTGMRESEMLALRLTAATDDGIRYTPAKQRKGQEEERVMAWSNELRAVWRAAAGMRIGAQPLFRTRTGGHYTRDGFQSLWQRWKGKAGVPDLRWHDLRRKSGSDADTEQEAQERLSHADPGVTRKHYRAKPARSKPAK